MNKMSEIDALHGVVKIQLGKMQRGGWKSTPDGYVRTTMSAEDRTELRDRLQNYVNKVMALADKMMAQDA
jgi:conjugal transfer/entry exclusion protein